ncbi:hypothetical protein [Portibacter marinus]|uniref:hypothetical protein n=1 Tax=Portibacter marinus TaxID=2898660 RepID=UPI001F23B220|nr:hypothetical protein [Portibacter marinus]
MKTISFLSILLSTLFFYSCTNLPGFNIEEEKSLTQFADGIIDFSSEYSAAPGPWSTFVVLGAPDTYPDYGDKLTAWASKTADGQDEFLTLAFDTAQYVNNVSIYETFNPGAVTGVSVRNTDNGSWVPVYTGAAERRVPRMARIKEISFPKTSFLVDAVKINIASRQVSGWNEIDAVSISGFYKD